MCGILALVRATAAASSPTWPLTAATNIVRHRGPDDAGFLLWTRGAAPTVYAAADTAIASRVAHRLEDLPDTANWSVGFGHRRLSIIDVSPAGHQPMVHRESGLSIVYNGEIYNYLELRAELTRLGHRFYSDSDTEVLLTAWHEWGPACLDRLNGMFAFVLLDPTGGGTLHAVRDRFGVKPLYWARVGDFLAFASECKQIRCLPGYAFTLDRSTARDYLAAGLLDHTRYTFHEGIVQLLGGERCQIDLRAADKPPCVSRWYELRPSAWTESDTDAAVRVRELLTDSIRLRLRSDVPVGSCLSGGLDSSSIVCLAHRLLAEPDAPSTQTTVTACYDDRRYDEWRFAERVVDQTGARAVCVWPTLERLAADCDRMLWHMDEPHGSTSQFSQWCVFAAAAESRLKVMLDGQGSDEQLAGYEGGTRVAFFTGLLRRGAILSLIREARAQRDPRRPAIGKTLLLAARNVLPILNGALPSRARGVPSVPSWLRMNAPSRIWAVPPRDLNDSLRSQTLATSLPALLRYEDRTSMAWSVESRVPFLDFRLVELLASFPDRLKIHLGVSKFVLREAMRGILPEPVRQRRDKMGFVTPEEPWFRNGSNRWFQEGIEAALDTVPELFDRDRTRRMVEDISAGTVPFSFAPWRILCLGRWLAICSDVTLAGRWKPAHATATPSGQ